MAKRQLEPPFLCPLARKAQRSDRNVLVNTSATKSAARARRALCLRAGSNTKVATGLHSRQAAILWRKSPATARSPAPDRSNADSQNCLCQLRLRLSRQGPKPRTLDATRGQTIKELVSKRAPIRLIRRAIVAYSTRNDRAAPDRLPSWISARNGFRSSQFIARAHREIS